MNLEGSNSGGQFLAHSLKELFICICQLLYGKIKAISVLYVGYGVMVVTRRNDNCFFGVKTPFMGIMHVQGSLKHKEYLIR